MSIQNMQPPQKYLEYQEAGEALRAVEQARRTAVAFFGITTFAILGLIYSRTAHVDTCTYLSVGGLAISSMSFNLFLKYTKTIKYTRKQLFTLQNTIGANVYSSSIQAESSERGFYIFLHVLTFISFVLTTAFFYTDASARHHLLFQSCSTFADIATKDMEKACPCGAYPLPTDIQGQDVCPSPSASSEKQNSQLIPFFSSEWWLFNIPKGPPPPPVP